MRIWARSLKPEIKEKIQNKQYSYDQLCQIRDAVTSSSRSKKSKPLIILIIVSAALLIGLLAYLLILLGNEIVLLCFLIVVYTAFGAWYGYGKMRFDFNSALKKGYPEIYKDLKIGFFYEEYVQK